MIQDILVIGTTSYTGARLRVIDSTDGTPETGFAYNTGGIDLWYQRQGATRTAIAEVTLAAVDTAYSSGGVIHVSDGYVRLDLPDAALVTGATFVDFGGTATGMVIIGGRIKLTAGFSFADAVRAGLTALPNAAAEAAGGLYTRGAGAG